MPERNMKEHPICDPFSGVKGDPYERVFRVDFIEGCSGETTEDGYSIKDYFDQTDPDGTALRPYVGGRQTVRTPFGHISGALWSYKVILGAYELSKGSVWTWYRGLGTCYSPKNTTRPPTTGSAPLLPKLKR